MKKQPRLGKQLKTAGVCMGMVVSSAIVLHADPMAADPSATDPQSMQKLTQENKDLKARLDALETAAEKEGWMPSNKGGNSSVAALSDITLSGFITTSYFHDSSEPPGHVSPGYLWNRVNDNFSLNKIKVTLASKPVERSGDKFDAAFRVSLIYGQDAPVVNSGFNGNHSTVTTTPGGATGTYNNDSGFNAVREAYVELNIPIGTGVNFRAGEMISLLNYESGDGGAANANFSQGYQWFFTGNGPAEGIQLGYTLTDWADVKLRVQNGTYAGPIDNNSSKSFIAALDLKPLKNLWVNGLVFGGREDAGFTENLIGAEILAGWNPTPQWTFGTELDWFNFYNPQVNPHPAVPPAAPTPYAGGHSDVYSAGLWTDYAFTKQFDLALRAEYLADHDGVDASGGALGFLNPVGVGQDLSSVALTLNYTPVPAIKFQPEIRYDHTSYSGGFVPGKQNRVIFGAGLSYLF
jgi:hypothetical protein